MEKRGQGAIEYLLIIGAAVVISVIVIAVIMGIGGTQQGATTQSTLEAQDIQRCAGTSTPSKCCSTTPQSIKYTGAGYIVGKCNLVPGCTDANTSANFATCR